MVMVPMIASEIEAAMSMSALPKAAVPVNSPQEEESCNCNGDEDPGPILRQLLHLESSTLAFGPDARETPIPYL